MTRSHTLPFLLVSLVVGCAPDDSTQGDLDASTLDASVDEADTSSSDASDTTDAGGSPDDASSDASEATPDVGEDASQDAGPTVCVAIEAQGCADTSGCGAGEACLRGSCLATCGASLEAWDAAMPEGLTPLRNVCARTGIMAVGGDPTCEGEATVFAITASAGAAGVTHEVRAGALEEGPTRAFANVNVATDGRTHFLGLNAAASPSGDRVAWGYTFSDVTGEVIVAQANGETLRWSSTGNYDVDWMGEEVVLVNGLSLGGESITGQGLYGIDLSTEPARTERLTVGPGSSSGAVSYLPRRGDVLIGGSEGFEGEVYIVGASDLAFDGSIDIAGSDLTSFETASDFELLAGRWLAGYDSTYTTFQYRELEADTLGPAAPFIDTDHFFEIVPIQGSDRFLLVHADGYLIVEAPGL